MKKSYRKPNLYNVTFNVEDIITTSDGPEYIDTHNSIVQEALDGGIEKDSVTEDIIKVTDIIKNVKRELFYCDDIVERTNKMVEDIKFIEEEKWNKQNEKEKVKDKKKVR